MSSAVKAIIDIYKGHSTLRPQVLEALGQAGGDQAVEAILSIYRGHSTLRPQVLLALGQAGKNANNSFQHRALRALDSL